MSTKPSASGTPTPRRRLSYPLLFSMVLPNLIWIALDRGMWVSDTALYGASTMRLRYLLTRDFSRWLQEALSISPKPPVIPWVGQFLVPFGELLGNVDSGVLLVTFLAQCLALLWLFEALFDYTGDELISMTGCAAVASAPLFIEVSKQLYVQPIQLAAVCWFVYIMARSRRWDPFVTLLQLIAATSLALLATMSSPAYCVLPGLVALWQAGNKLRGGRSFDGRYTPHVVLASLLAVPTLLWYERNVAAAIEYGSFSFDYVYGGRVGLEYLGKLATWLVLVVHGFQFSLVVTLLLLLGVSWILWSRRSARAQPWTGPIAVGLIQIAIALAIVSMSQFQDRRYPLALLGYVGLILGTSLKTVDRTWLTYGVLATMVLQLGAANAGAFGFERYNLTVLQPVELRPPREVELVEAISKLADRRPGNRAVLITGGLGIYSMQVEYHSAKRHHFPEDDSDFLTAEFVLTWPEISGDVDRAWERIKEFEPTLFVLLNGSLRQSQLRRWAESPSGWADIMLGAVELSERVVKATTTSPSSSQAIPKSKSTDGGGIFETQSNTRREGAARAVSRCGPSSSPSPSPSPESRRFSLIRWRMRRA